MLRNLRKAPKYDKSTDKLLTLNMSITLIGSRSTDKTSNATIAGNGRALEAYMLFTWLYLFKK